MVKTIQISLNYKAIMKYGVITLCANLLIFLIIDNYLVYESELFSFIPNLLFFFSIGIGLFIGISYITDKQTRELLTSIIKEIKPDHS